MKDLDIGGLINHTTTLNSMIKENLEKDRKHAENARCKAGNWGGVVNYIEYAFDIKCTEEELLKELRFYKQYWLGH